MTDRSLFDPEPSPPPTDEYDTARALARTTDPQTSKAGALDAAQRLGALQERALRAVRRHPGRTSLELSRLECIDDPRVLNRRLGELERLGKLRRGPARACEISGRSAAVWFIGKE